MRYVLILLAALAVAGFGQQAMAAAAYNAETGEGFAEPTFRDLSMMLVMMEGVDIHDPKVADDYAKMNFCGLYKDKYKNDFEWNKVREQVITRILSKKDYYRLQYELDGTINLDRYNFDAQDFPLTSQTVMDRVGSMILYDASTATDNAKGASRFLCNDDAFTHVFPGMYMFILTQPLTFDRLKLPADEAKSLLERMAAVKNNDRRLYVRFRLRITGIDKVRATRSDNVQVDVKGDIVAVDVFLDREMTKFLTSINLTKFLVRRAKPMAALPAPGPWLMLLVSIVGLYVELVLIRWIGTEIRVFAFVSNLVLLACFLGFGVGCLKSGRPESLMPTLVALLALTLIVDLPFAGWQSFLLNLSNLLTLSPDAVLWGDPWAPNGAGNMAVLTVCAVALVTLVLWLITSAMIPLGQWIGYCFDNSKNTVRTYSVNLVGSLLGSWLLVALSLFRLSPLWWIAFAFILILLVTPRSRPDWVKGILILAAALFALSWQQHPNVFWSPYQKLQVFPMKNREAGYYIYVNNIGYMSMLNLTPAMQKKWPQEMAPHDISFDSSFRILQKGAKVLVLGAGAGNDVAACLRNGAAHVDAIEIDPVIYDLGKRLHPEHPYDSDKVNVVINDARNFLRETKNQYDVIIFAFLDSVSQASGYTNMRVDNYVYSREAFAQARQLLKPDGVLILKYDARKPWTWVGQRYYRTLSEVFGREPMVYVGPNFGNEWPGATFLESNSDTLKRRAAAIGLDAYAAGHPPPFPTTVKGAPEPSTDDWPYPTSYDRSIPHTYLTVSAILVILAFFLVKPVLNLKERPTWTMFSLGAGFMLMETQLISRLTLYFGTTWIVNSIAISTILAVLVLANLFLETGKRRDFRRACYAILVLSLAANYLMPWEQLPLSSWAIGLLLSAAYAVSVLMAGIIFTTTLRESVHKSAALGANVIGAVVGGLSLNLSFIFGVKALLILAAAFYICAAFLSGVFEPKRGRAS